MTAGQDAARLAKVYRTFADIEVVGRSLLYVELCHGIATDEALLSRLVQLPLEKRQPNLLLAAVKYLFGTARDWPHFRELVETRWNDITAVMFARRTQTNEPARCAVLLPLLALLPQPLALLEVGAAAGLCLLPDRYAYAFNGQPVFASAPVTEAPPVFHCTVNEKTPVPTANVQIAWRAGLDIAPLDCRSADDTRWLEALVWPGEGECARLLGEALAIARHDPPQIVQGDLRTDLVRLAAEAPKTVTLVVFHTAVLNYVRDHGDRQAFAKTVHGLNAVWLCNESIHAFTDMEGVSHLPWPDNDGRFLLSLNGKPIAYTDPHGNALDWFASPDALML